jgi:hypothetical protein
MSNEMKELKTSMKEVSEATKTKATYTQAATTATTEPTPTERGRCDVTLIATSDNAKKNLANSTYRVITSSHRKCDPKSCKQQHRKG